MLHLEFAAGLSGAAYEHGLQVEDVNLEEVAGHLLLMPGLFPSLLHFAWFYQSSSFINLYNSSCNTIDVAYSNYTSEDIQWQGHLAINIT